ncbi:hypothetical protein Taro_030957 [Colocasia esculenta]|uniref:Uncharacterized protein n=1 Tax=Colocasia esculenta TaxID=4460 RepID=A0A843W4Y6_COLES|nr:hypothetical protein [Colocasia esculenta]
MRRVAAVCRIGLNELVTAPPPSAAAVLVLRTGENRRRVAQSGVPTSSRGVKADKGEAVIVDHSSANGSSSSPRRGEHGNCSQSVIDLPAEVNNIEPLPTYVTSEASASEFVDSAYAFAEAGTSTGQFPLAPADDYIPRPAEDPPAIEPVCIDDQVFCNQLLSWGMMDSYSTFSTCSPFLPWGGLENLFLDPPAYSAFQIGENEIGILEPGEYDPGLSDLPISGGHLDPPPADFFSIPQEFCVENFAETSIPEAEIEERNPPPDDLPLPNFTEDRSPALEVGALSEHGVEWPARDQPSSGPADDDLWDFLVSRVRAVVDSEDPPPIEAVKRVLKDKTLLAFNSGIAQSRWMEFVEIIWGEVCHHHGSIIWAPYDQRIQSLENDLCLLANSGEKRGSRIAEVRRGRKSRKLKIAEERENLIRLQREIEEACSSLDQRVREDTKDSEEETALFRR